MPLGYAVIFDRYCGFLNQLKQASHDLAAISAENRNSKFDFVLSDMQ